MSDSSINAGNLASGQRSKRAGSGLTGGQTVRLLRAKVKAEDNPKESKHILGMPDPDDFPNEPWSSPEQRARLVGRMKFEGISNAEEMAKLGPSAVAALIEIARNDQPNLAEALFARVSGFLPRRKYGPIKFSEGRRF
jgi:hypothetical protein